MTRAKVLIIVATVLAIAVGLTIFLTHRPAPPQPANGRADRIVVEKQKHILTLFKRGHAVATYRVALGHGGLAPKTQEGDGLTPEGHYIIDGRNEHSAFHKALHISYPSPADRAAAAARHLNPGGAIMIHGMRNGLGWLGPQHTQIDWTNGCIAVTDAEIDKLWAAVPDGTPIEIRP